ncbi:MAG: hypothetical protein AVDCRST_MAG06-2495, partial [uncultured Nocardioides sp.]
ARPLRLDRRAGPPPAPRPVRLGGPRRRARRRPPRLGRGLDPRRAAALAARADGRGGAWARRRASSDTYAAGSRPARRHRDLRPAEHHRDAADGRPARRGVAAGPGRARVGLRVGPARRGVRRGTDRGGAPLAAEPDPLPGPPHRRGGPPARRARSAARRGPHDLRCPRHAVPGVDGDPRGRSPAGSPVPGRRRQVLAHRWRLRDPRHRGEVHAVLRRRPPRRGGGVHVRRPRHDRGHRRPGRPPGPPRRCRGARLGRSGRGAAYGAGDRVPRRLGHGDRRPGGRRPDRGGAPVRRPVPQRRAHRGARRRRAGRPGPGPRGAHRRGGRGGAGDRGVDRRRDRSAAARQRRRAVVRGDRRL